MAESSIGLRRAHSALATVCLFLVTLPFFWSCKSRGFSEESQAKEIGVGLPVKPKPQGAARSFLCNPTGLSSKTQGVDIGAQPIYAYHWTDDSSVLGADGLKKWLEGRFEDATSISLEESANALGEGLYLSATPLMTAGLGEILVAVPLKENCKALKLSSVDWESSPDDQLALESDASLVLFDADGSETRVLVRSASGIRMDLAAAMDTRKQEGIGLEAIPEIKNNEASNWKLAVDHFGAAFSFFGAAFIRTNEFPLFKDGNPTSLAQAKLVTSNLTTEGWLVAMQAEISSGGVIREQSLDKAMGEGSTSYPTCSRVEIRFPYRGSKHRACLVELFEFLASQLAPQLATDPETTAMDYKEARLILNALGYGSLFPNPAPSTAPVSLDQMKTELNKFFATWKSVPGKAASAAALLKASALFAMGETKEDLDSL